MHDFLLAKEIVSQLNDIIQEKKISNIKSVDVEIGVISMAHDGHAEHTEDISLENLNFGLESIVRGTKLENVVFRIKKTSGESWKITNVEI